MVYKTIAYAVLLGTSVMAAPTPKGDDNVNKLSGHMREALIPIPVPVGVPGGLPVPVAVVQVPDDPKPLAGVPSSVRNMGPQEANAIQHQGTSSGPRAAMGGI